jgi:hypothetical protein
MHVLNSFKDSAGNIQTLKMIQGAGASTAWRPKTAAKLRELVAKHS